jgi:hypothetical protein
MTPVILPRRHPYLHSNGVMTAMPPNPLTMKIMAQGRIGQGMAPTRHASERRCQKINTPHDFTLHGNCSHRIRRRTATPQATFFAFLFHFFFFCFHPFYRKCNPSPPLRSYKRGGAGARAIKDDRTESKGDNQATTARTHLKPPPPPKRLGTYSLSRKLVTPTTSTPVQGNTKRSETH